MSSFGETLRAAREAKGLSCSQVAAQTHMLVQIVEEMEREDFHRIPAPIYGRGFVRLFADCVGLDPVPLVREFMDIYEGRRAPTASIREVPAEKTPPPAETFWHRSSPSVPAPQPEPAPVPEPIPVAMPEPIPVAEPEPIPVAMPEPIPATTPEPIPVVEPEPIPAPEPEPIPAPEPEPVPVPAPEPVPVLDPKPVPEPESTPKPEPVAIPKPEPPKVVRGLDLFEQSPSRSVLDDMPLFQTPPAKPATSTNKEPPAFDSPYLTPTDYEHTGPSAAERFRKSLSAVTGSVLKKVRSIPRRTWRIAALALGAVLVVAFIIWSICKLYSATATPSTDTPRETVPTEAVVQPETPVPSEPTPAPQVPTAKPTTPTKKHVKLISTGPSSESIPDLYIDD